ncbi:interferon gamma receptor 2 [Zootoca vivipara]|uniref:interferon gamma receptor 2 n=1 Tax=Zootoca vivipara TaxID=8524 RepID=UPI001591F933|nr:interferon gamma receptor 2 [Zootoca vivipara]
MQPLGPLCVLFCLARPLLGVAATESSSLSAPENVTIQSYNFNNVLKWSPVTAINGSVTYSVEWRFKTPIASEVKVWEKVNCTDITKPECNFNHERNHDCIILRVRAEQGELKSTWTETKPFRARQDTILGPPRAISLSSEGTTIHISFLPPFEHPENKIEYFEYLIEYWEESTSEILRNLSKNRRETFKNLKERTVYCFQVTASIPHVNLTCQKSKTKCKETTTDPTRILHVVLIFGFAIFILIGIFVCIMLIQKYRSVIKAIWKPPLTIPSHFEEDLQNLHTTVVEEFQNCAGEDHWDNVSEISEQRQTVTDNFTDQNQELAVEEHR